MTTVNTDLTSMAGGLILGVVGSFFLMMIVLNSALSGSAGKFAPSAISMTVAFCIMSFGPVTDAAINHARTLGPAIGTGDYSQVLPYIIAQFVGAAVAATAYRFMFAQKFGDEMQGNAEEPAF